MVVQHNLTAMNSNRMLGLTTASQSKSTERLSSGYKINRAADDAAGLSISEKMRKQIRGLTQASSNAQDGISTVQTAEGALTEVHDMLQRMNELAVKASNGTQSETDRGYIQSEIDQLVTEIDRVSTTTKFNEIYLLKGTNSDGTVAKTTYNTAQNGDLVKALDTGSNFDTQRGSFKADLTAVDNTAAATAMGGDLDTTSLTSLAGQNTKLAGKFITVTKADATGTDIDYTYALVDYSAAEDATKAEGYLNVNQTIKEVNETDWGAGKVVRAFDNLDDLMASMKDDLDLTGDVKSMEIVNDNSTGALVTSIKVSTFADQNNGLDISLHVGADSTEENKINMNLAMMSARGLGINGIKVTGDNSSNADAAIDTIANAIKRVSTQRSALGAAQNRLEHTINNLDNIVENTTSAESAIRDTDMATEMVKYSNNNILSQAGQAMLAQANQVNQGVLSLLQ